MPTRKLSTQPLNASEALQGYRQRTPQQQRLPRQPGQPLGDYLSQALDPTARWNQPGYGSGTGYNQIHGNSPLPGGPNSGTGGMGRSSHERPQPEMTDTLSDWMRPVDPQATAGAPLAGYSPEVTAYRQSMADWQERFSPKPEPAAQAPANNQSWFDNNTPAGWVSPGGAAQQAPWYVTSPSSPQPGGSTAGTPGPSGTGSSQLDQVNIDQAQNLWRQIQDSQAQQMSSLRGYLGSVGSLNSGLGADTMARAINQGQAQGGDVATNLAEVLARNQMGANQWAADYGLRAGQFDLNRQLGLGNLGLQAGQLGLQRELGLGELDLNRQLGVGQLDLSQQQLGQQDQQFYAGQQFQGDQGELDRAFQLGYLGTQQSFQGGQSQAGREHELNLAELQLNNQASLQSMQQAFQGGQSQAQREHEASLSSAQLNQQGAQFQGGQQFQGQQAALDRAQQLDLADLSAAQEIQRLSLELADRAASRGLQQDQTFLDAQLRLSQLAAQIEQNRQANQLALGQMTLNTQQWGAQQGQQSFENMLTMSQLPDESQGLMNQWLGGGTPLNSGQSYSFGTPDAFQRHQQALMPPWFTDRSSLAPVSSGQGQGGPDGYEMPGLVAGGGGGYMPAGTYSSGRPSGGGYMPTGTYNSGRSSGGAIDQPTATEIQQAFNYGLISAEQATALLEQVRNTRTTNSARAPQVRQEQQELRDRMDALRAQNARWIP